jgi:uroporphyrinogen decarboxylase
MQEFLIDLAIDPAIPIYMMDRILDVHKENTRRVLEIAGDRLDMIYFYDDVATQNSLMISKNMWRDLIRPRHMQIIEIAKTFGKPVMYHCDGAIGSLIPELIDMGIDLLNPIQIDAKGMDPAWLKAEYGQQISFHGGIDIVHTLPKGSIKEVEKEVRERVRVLGKDGGYVLASSHHIQSDTPTENVIAMYQEPLRRLEE